MPARTNSFQKIVVLIEQALAPRGAKITESAMVQVAGLQEAREVDVLLDGEFGPFHMKVAIEAKDHGKPIALPTYESIIGKYRCEGRVVVDKVVIVSSRGFSKGVIAKAALQDVELLTVREATQKDWGITRPKGFSVKVRPHFHFQGFDPPIPLADPQFAFRKGHVTYQHGRDHGTAAKWIDHFFFHHWLPQNKDLLGPWEKQVNEKHAGNAMLKVNLSIPPGFSLRFGGQMYPLVSIRLLLHFVNEQGSVTHRRFERHSTKGGIHNLHHIEGATAKTKMSVTFAEGKQKELCMADGTRVVGSFPEKIILNLGKADVTSAHP